MGFGGSRRLVGLGFGAIQAGLFAYEAQRSGAYAPPLMVDVRPELVAALRADGGHFRVNIARADRIDVADVGPVEAADSRIPADRERVVDAIAAADELASALPSVAFYRTDAPNSPHLLLAEALARRTAERPLIVLCAENHRSAAALLETAVLAALPAGSADLVHGKARWVDTVIGKMSGLIDDPAEIAALGLATITPHLHGAFLVEAFDRILIAAVGYAHGVPMHTGMAVLREVQDLAPFEDAKLLGHNATHALAGFLGQLAGLHRMAELEEVPGAMAFLRAAFIEESGRALIARHAGADALFTPRGYAAFADDLLARMVNPHLADTVERAARDPRRKLAWEDRLAGLVRVGLAVGVPTPRYAMGIAAGLAILGASSTSEREALLDEVWGRAARGQEGAIVRSAIEDGAVLLGRWRREGFEGLADLGG
jgi:mannitol-1-phosphate 5-dehydrogenase